MPLTAMPIEQFVSLNLRDDPQEVGAKGAIDSVNVLSDRRGRLRTRNGFTDEYAGPAVAATTMYPLRDGNVMVAFSGNSVKVVTIASGTAVATTGLTSTASSFVSVGSSGGTYFTDSTFAQVQRYQAGAFTSPAGLAGIEGHHLGRQPLDDRLVIADANTNSLLRFSNAGAPETLSADDTVTLTPGDVQGIAGIEAWGDLLFVFKQTKFFVFYGNSTDTTGAAVFNYRLVDTGIGCSLNGSRRLTAAHPSGVYFVARDGVYRTTGGSPVLVSDAISPVFSGAKIPIPAPFSSVLASAVENWDNLAATSRYLFLTGGGVTFVMDFEDGAWTVFEWPVVSILDGNIAAQAGELDDVLILGGSVGAISTSSATDTDDDGTAIDWQYQSGFYDISGKDLETYTRYATLKGSGTPTVAVLTDYGTTDAHAGAVTLGTAPAVAEGFHNKSYAGTLFSHRLSGSGPAATIASFTHWVSHVRGTGLRRS